MGALRVKCDIDNTLNSLMRTTLTHLPHEISYEECTEYDFSNFDHKIRDQIMRLWADKTVWDSCAPLRNAQTYLKKINNEFELILVTASEPHIVQWKIDWLKKYFPFINESQVCMIGEQRAWLMTDFSIDDYQENLKQDYGHRIIIDCPWNKNVNDDVWSFVRVASLKEAYEYMKHKEEEEYCQ